MARLSLQDTYLDITMKLSNGNPGCITFLINLLQYCGEHQLNIGAYVGIIDNMQLYEDRLYMLWNDSCDRNMDKVIEVLNAYANEKITDKDIKERILDVEYGKTFDDLLQDGE